MDRPDPDAAPAPAPPPEWIVAKDRARRFGFRLEQVAKERATAWAGDRVGMTSFAEAGPVLLAIEDDLEATVEAVLAGRQRDRERGPSEIPLVVALEGVLERVRRARRLAEWRRTKRAPAEWAERRFAEVLADAGRRLQAFAAVYDEKRIVALPAPSDVARLLRRLEDDAETDRLGNVVTSLPAPTKEAADRPLPRLVTDPDALDDLLRAARAEVADARLPWRVEPATATTPLVLALGAAPALGSPRGERAEEEDDEGDAATAVDSSPAARTDRAAAVLRFAHGVEVRRETDARGRTTRIALALVDVGAAAAADAAPAARPLPPKSDAAVRAWNVAKGASDYAYDPARLVAAKGLLRAVAAETERVLAPMAKGSAPRVVAAAVPREDSRKAPVRREVVAALRAAVPEFPVHRVEDVLSAVVHGKTVGANLRPPDAAVGFAFFGRRWKEAGGFGDRALSLGDWTDDDVMAAVREAIALHAVEQSLERGRDPGAGWDARLEETAFSLLERLARATE